MKRAFTLIELLVVVAIIIVLIAILLPGLTLAREQAKSVKCLMALRQFATAANIYADESNNWMVPARTADGVCWYSNIQFRKALNFTNDWGAYPASFICPNSIDMTKPYLPGLYKIENTYGENYEGLSGSYYGYKRTAIIAPATKILFADANDFWINRWWSSSYAGEKFHSSTYPTAVAYRHTGNKINIGFFDGHAESLPRYLVDRTLAPNQSANLSLWRPLSE